MDTWNEYFYNIAQTVARNSKCYSRKIGAILVRENAIVSTGYNGPPRRIPQCDTRDIYINNNLIYSKLNDGVCPRRSLGHLSGQFLDICIAAHAEVNCIAQAARNGINTKGATMYMTCEIPCKNCLATLINAGVEDLVVTAIKFYDDASEYIVKYSHISIRDYDNNFYLRGKGNTL